MRRLWGAAWFALGRVYVHLYLFSLSGLIWLVACLAPLGVGIAAWVWELPLIAWLPLQLAVGMLTSPCTAALYHLAWQSAREQRIEWADWLAGLRLYGRFSLWIGGAVWLSGAVCLVDVIFYLSHRSNFLSGLPGLLGLWLLLFWAGMQVYVWPLMVAQEQPDLWLLLKNAVLLTLSFPLLTLLALLIHALVLGLGLVLPILLLPGIPLLAVMNSRFLQLMLQHVAAIQQKKE